MKKLNKNWIILPYNSISKTMYNNFFKSPRIGFLKFNSKKLNYRSYIMNSIYSLKMVLLNFQNYAVIMFLWRQIVICFMDFSAIRIYVISLTIFCFRFVNRKITVSNISHCWKITPWICCRFIFFMVFCLDTVFTHHAFYLFVIARLLIIGLFYGLFFCCYKCYRMFYESGCSFL